MPGRHVPVSAPDAVCFTNQESLYDDHALSEDSEAKRSKLPVTQFVYISSSVATSTFPNSGSIVQSSSATWANSVRVRPGLD